MTTAKCSRWEQAADFLCRAKMTATDSYNLKTASQYVNNLLLARGLLRNGKPIEFARPSKGENGADATMAQIINLVHDLILRRDVSLRLGVPKKRSNVDNVFPTGSANKPNASGSQPPFRTCGPRPPTRHIPSPGWKPAWRTSLGNSPLPMRKSALHAPLCGLRRVRRRV